jgi:diacylglycerol kinase family enzyme
MTIAKGRPWGETRPLPEDGVVVSSDAELRAVVEAARGEGRDPPVAGLLGGDLCRTLGGPGSPARLRSSEAVTFPVDVVRCEADGGRYWFVAHLVARTHDWRRALVAMNGQWIGTWNMAPRAHPDDGRVDVLEAGLGLRELVKVRARLPRGAHLPHPGIHEHRAGSFVCERGFPIVRLDGIRMRGVRTLRLEVEPDALRVVV